MQTVDTTKIDIAENAQIIIKWYPDDDADLSWLGTFTDRWEPDAIDHRKRRGDRHAYQWFVPARTFLEQRAELKALGYSHADASKEALKYLRDDYKRAATYGDHWWMLWYDAALIVDGEEVAEDQCGGIESDGGPAQFEREIETQFRADYAEYMQAKIAASLYAYA